MKKIILFCSVLLVSINSYAETKITCSEVENIFKTDSYISRYQVINSLKILPSISNWSEGDFKQFNDTILWCKKEGFLKRYGDAAFSQYIIDALGEIKTYRDQQESSKSSENKAVELLTKIEVKVDNLTDVEIVKVKKELEEIEKEMKTISLNYLPTNEISKKEEAIEEKIQKLKNKILENEIKEQQLAMEKETLILINKFKADSAEQARDNQIKNPADFKTCEKLKTTLVPLDSKRKVILKQIANADSQKMKLLKIKEYDDLSYKADQIRPQYMSIECPKYFHD